MRYLFASILAFILLFSCKNNENIYLPTGSLDFYLILSPLCPVEPCKQTAEEIAKIYANYTVIISDSSTSKALIQMPLKYDGKSGKISIKDLKPATYAITLAPPSFFTRKVFPIYAIIEKNKNTVINISLDTGIR